MIFALLNRMWHSPTFTSWGNKIAASARLLIVLPLVLSRFDEVQVASWLLFGALLFFGRVITGQLSLVASRFIAIAYGGARDLTPITPSKVPSVTGSINWDLIVRLYGSMTSLNFLGAFLATIATALVGIFSIEPLVQNYEHKVSIWLAFGVFVAGQFVVQAFERYAIALRGLNRVSLVNRWNIAFSLTSSLLGSVALNYGADIVVLALVMQSVAIASVFRQWFMLNYFVEPRFRDMPFCIYDAEIYRAVWGPLWRSFIRAMSNRGSGKIALIFLAREASPTALSGILLTLRFLETVDELASAPLSSKVPFFGQLLGRGDLKSFSSGIARSYGLSAMVFAAGVVALGLGMPMLVAMMGSDVVLPSLAYFLVLASGHMLVAQIRLALLISVVGNHIIAVWRLALSAMLAGVIAYFLIPQCPLWGYVVAAYGSTIVILNVYPFVCGCKLMGVNTSRFLLRAVLPSWFILGLAALLFMQFPIQNISLDVGEWLNAWIH